jgi:hypothetical protein
LAASLGTRLVELSFCSPISAKYADPCYYDLTLEEGMRNSKIREYCFSSFIRLIWDLRTATDIWQPREKGQWKIGLPSRRFK